MITITDVARNKIIELKERSGKPIKGLRITATPRSPLKADFSMSFVKEEETVPAEDVTIELEGLRVFISPESGEYLRGANVDYIETPMGSGFKIDAPLRKLNTPDDAVAEKIQHLLDSQINPAIAGHGGSIELIDVRGDTAFVEMRGGCQGCAMSRMTLKHGVEQVILENVPEIRQVLDVTDHAGGTNPYYQE
jgi:Fe/S biogenesis protein NfuA